MILQFPRSSNRKNLTPLGITSHEALADQRLDYQLKTLELSAMLHRKQDMALLLECFFVEVQTWVKIEGIKHQSIGSTTYTLIGSQRQHQVRFELKLGEVSLGDIVIFRATPFTPRQQRELERQALHLVYPVKSALAHAKEVEAALTDNLTGLQNRLAFEKCLAREILLSQRNEIPLSLLMIDLDFFAAVNEHHGYEIGDSVLKSVAELLRKTARKSDMLFRYDTDTFVVVLSGTEYNGAKVLAERIRSAIGKHFHYGNINVVFSASAGITEVREQDSADAVTDRALAALINAKLAGRNRLRAEDETKPQIQLI